MPRTAPWTLLLLSLVWLGGCPDCQSSSKNTTTTEQGDTLDYELFPSTIELSADTLATLQSSQPDGTLRFSPPPEQLVNVHRGSILVAGSSEHTPLGLCRYVGEVQRAGNELLLKTMNVPLMVAYKKLHLEVAGRTVAQRPDGGALQAYVPKVVMDPTGSFTVSSPVFNGDGDTSTQEDQLNQTTDITAGIWFQLSVNGEWEPSVGGIGQDVADCLESLWETITFQDTPDCGLDSILPTLKISFDVAPHFNADIHLWGSAFRQYQWDKPLGVDGIPLTWICFGPVCFELRFSVMGHFLAAAHARLDVRALAEYRLSMGVDLDTQGNINPRGPTTEISNVELVDADMCFDANIYVAAGPKLALRFYGFMGPYAELDVYMDAKASLERNPCYQANMGLKVLWGIELGVPFAGDALTTSWDADPIDLASAEVASGSCRQLCNSTNIVPPGSGPDGENFTHPSFTPWSKHYHDMLESYPFVGTALHWNHVTRSIDGNVVASGSNFGTLLKINEGGQPVWAKRFIDPTGDVGQPLAIHMLGVEHTLDTHLMVLGHPYSLLDVGQGGGLYWAKRYSPAVGDSGGGPYGSSNHQHRFMAILGDGQNGFYIVGTYTPPETDPTAHAWILHVDRDGNVLSSREYSLAGWNLYPEALHLVDGDLVVTGLAHMHNPITFHGMALRLAPDGSVRWAKRYIGGGRVEPVTSIQSRAGSVILAGTTGSYGRAFLLAVNPADGAVQWTSVLTTGSDLSYMPMTSVVELPTGGFLVTGTYTPEYDPDELYAALLDARGEPQWLSSYRILHPEDTHEADVSGGSALLTDDGGGLIMGHHTVGLNERSVVAAKVFLKNGMVNFATNGVQHSRPVEIALDGAMFAEDWTPTVGTVDVKPQPYALTEHVVDVQPVQHAP